MTRQKALLELLNTLDLFYTDLNRLLVQYDTRTPWQTTACNSWNQNSPCGLLSFEPHRHIHVCTRDSHLVFTFNTSGEILQKNLSLESPSGIDIDEKNSLLYIADQTHITILNLKLESLSSWKLSKESPSTWSFRGLKVDGNILYLTISGLHEIFSHNSQDGKLLKEFGSEGSENGAFNYPLGLTVNNKYVYICDRNNHRVQILTKEDGIYFSKWGNGTKQGQFEDPRSIYNCLSEDLIYVGDSCSVQIFRRDSICIQRLGDKESGTKMNQFNIVYGICVMYDRLYVSDWNNHRIQIFEWDNQT